LGSSAPEKTVIKERHLHEDCKRRGGREGDKREKKIEARQLAYDRLAAVSTPSGRRRGAEKKKDYQPVLATGPRDLLTRKKESIEIFRGIATVYY